MAYITYWKMMLPVLDDCHTILLNSLKLNLENVWGLQPSSRNLTSFQSKAATNWACSHLECITGLENKHRWTCFCLCVVPLKGLKLAQFMLSGGDILKQSTWRGEEAKESHTFRWLWGKHYCSERIRKASLFRNCSDIQFLLFHSPSTSQVI